MVVAEVKLDETEKPPGAVRGPVFLEDDLLGLMGFRGLGADGDKCNHIRCGRVCATCLNLILSCRFDHPGMFGNLEPSGPMDFNKRLPTYVGTLVELECLCRPQPPSEARGENPCGLRKKNLPRGQTREVCAAAQTP